MMQTLRGTQADWHGCRVRSHAHIFGCLHIPAAASLPCAAGCDIDLYDTVQHFVGLDGRPAPHWGTVDLDTLKELCQVRSLGCAMGEAGAVHGQRGSVLH